MVSYGCNAEERVRILTDNNLTDKIYYYTKGLSFLVDIIDIRQTFGRYDALIMPVSGSGQIWVSLKNLTNSAL